ncbi:hypothetical protein Srot_0793 [Segniliparus rotundus DSM 44985]|uniref:Uncharacterized protein n=1 Tax=Segniliparus rotundus (strain ATCC BAA-972 / CDC 1076 / CIP 108378 / DSM 44985 / JCM 13578) TaxID=640132 RepID=D6ZDZ2_SEGRD|nr:hypothetical protein [Segniliparus rotundus]ADG97272.1 hypothetical protein Srot_0793 [Segniliparus rotundus DSM 44985]
MAGIVLLAVFGIATYATHFVRTQAEQKAKLAATPKSIQEAQDTVYRYYQRTLQDLPEGIELDNTRSLGASATVTACDDNAADKNNAPASYGDSRALIDHHSTDYPTLITKIGDIWRGWGWKVEQHEGTGALNRFGHSPDGYELSVTYSPLDPTATIYANSPCFPGDWTRYSSIPEARTITKDGPQPSHDK